MSTEMKSVFFLAILVIFCENGCAEKEMLSIYPLIMPRLVPAKNEVYLCTYADLSQTNETFWIRGFDPKITNGNVFVYIFMGK